MRKLLIAALMAAALSPVAHAQVSVGVGINAPGVSIGINVPSYPRLVRIPGYPVYYDPGLPANYFFYDGLYWVLIDDSWYVSDWYNGPWRVVSPDYVPVYLLRVPVRYYRHPPAYFRGWAHDAPPRWGEHWGRDWQQRHDGWNRRNRQAAPAPAPLPRYQREYRGDRYPQAIEQQRSIREQHYRFQPRDPVVREHVQPRGDRGNRGERGGDHDRGRPQR